MLLNIGGNRFLCILSCVHYYHKTIPSHSHIPHIPSLIVPSSLCQQATSLWLWVYEAISQVNSWDINQPEAKLNVLCYIILEEEIKNDPVSSSSPSGLSRGQRRKQPEMFKPNLSFSKTVSQSFPVCGMIGLIKFTHFFT